MKRMTEDEVRALMIDRNLFVSEINKFIPDLTKIPYNYFKALVNVWCCGKDPGFFGVIMDDWYSSISQK